MKLGERLYNKVKEAKAIDTAEHDAQVTSLTTLMEETANNKHNFLVVEDAILPSVVAYFQSEKVKVQKRGRGVVLTWKDAVIEEEVIVTSPPVETPVVETAPSERKPGSNNPNKPNKNK